MGATCDPELLHRVGRCHWKHWNSHISPALDLGEDI